MKAHFLFLNKSPLLYVSLVFCASLCLQTHWHFSCKTASTAYPSLTAPFFEPVAFTLKSDSHPASFRKETSFHIQHSMNVLYVPSLDWAVLFTIHSVCLLRQVTTSNGFGARALSNCFLPLACSAWSNVLKKEAWSVLLKCIIHIFSCVLKNKRYHFVLWKPSWPIQTCSTE